MSSYVIDPDEATLSFAVRGLAPTRGTFTGLTGFMVTDTRGDPQHVEVSIPAGSLTTGLSLRDAHLRSATFFDARRYPVIKFASDHIERTEQNTFAVHGMLSLHGRERPVRLDVALDAKSSRRVRVTGVVRRSAFAIPRNRVLHLLMRLAIGDAVRVTAEGLGVLMSEDSVSPAFTAG